jgi:hypothetical protein
MGGSIRTGRVATVPEIGVIGAGFGSLCAASGDYVTRDDPGSGRIVARWYIARASGLAFGGGDVWVLTYPRSDSPTVFDPIARTAAVWELDPATDRVAPRLIRLAALEPIAISSSATNVCVGDDATATVTNIRIAHARLPGEVTSPHSVRATHLRQTGSLRERRGAAWPLAETGSGVT